METADLIVWGIALVVSVVFIVNGLDDLFIDLNYYLRGLGRRSRHNLSVDDLLAKPQQRIAIIVPAWHEAPVIQHMLANTLSTVDYNPQNFHIFVGTYLNDPETQDKVDEIASRLPNIHKVVVPHDGPTSKADCLNWVYQGVLLAEEQVGIHFDILLMHDAEDVIHPLALRLYNYLLPQYDFVQTPVLPLEIEWTNLVGGSYLDEFTESHIKDLVVRGTLGGLVPSAGVGSGFARAAFEEIALANDQQAFDVGSLTEDYEIGLKFRLAGKKTYFATHSVSRQKEVRAHWWSKKTKQVMVDEYIATREFFPSSFNTATRQRARWILGINFQTWAKIGWQGPPIVLYCLWRDRRAVFAHVSSTLGYGVVLYCITRLVVDWLGGPSWSFERVFVPGSLLSYLMIAATVLFVWRMLMKVITVRKVYGMAQAFLSLPRFVVGNIVNFVATCRATKQWTMHKLTDAPLRWAKTDHRFPTTTALLSFHDRLGDLLVKREGLTKEQLDDALSLQAEVGGRLGEVLTVSGIASPSQVTNALGAQLSIPVLDPDPRLIPLSLLAQVPEDFAEEHRICPVNSAEAFATVAVSHPLTRDQKIRIETLLGAPIRLGFVGHEQLRLVREQAYRRLKVGDEDVRLGRLGERLLFLDLINKEQLDECLLEQRTTGELLGEILTRKQYVRPESVAAAATGAMTTGFVRPQLHEVDVLALELVGYGTWAMCSAVPLLSSLGAIRVAAAYPIHPATVRMIAQKLGREVTVQLAPLLEVRLALRLAADITWPHGIAAGVSGVDGVELAVIGRKKGLGEDDLRSFALAAQNAAKSPIDHALSTGLMMATEAAEARGEVLGIAVSPMSAHQPGWIPPSTALTHRLSVLGTAVEGIGVATPSPSVHVARMLGRMFPSLPVLWHVGHGRQDDTRVEAGDLACEDSGVVLVSGSVRVKKTKALG